MEVVGYITTVIVLVFICCGIMAYISAWISGLRNKPKPRLAGAVIPILGDGLEISKRYDIVYGGGDYGSQVVERIEGVRIVGYVGKEDDEAVGKMYIRSRWLVVEFADGRLAYLMPHSIISLTESAMAR